MSARPVGKGSAALRLNGAVPALIFLAWGWNLGAIPPWRDEAATLLFSSYSVTDLFTATSHVDRSMAPYYLLMHSLSGMAEPLYAMRVVSLVAIGVGIFLGARTATMLFGELGGWIAGLALCGNQLLVDMAQQARVYGLSFLAFTLATWLLVRMVSGEGRTGPRHAVAYLLSLLTVALLHLMFLPSMLAHPAFLWAKGVDRRTWISVVPSWIVTMVVALLTVWTSSSQTGQLDWVARPGPRSLGEAYLELAGSWVVFVLVTIALVLASLAVLRRESESVPGAVLGLALYIAAPLALAGVSLLVTPVFLSRYMLPGCLGAALLLAGVPGLLGAYRPAGAYRSGRLSRWAGGALVGMLVSVLMLELLTLRPLLPNDDGLPQISEEIRQSVKPGDWLLLQQGGSSSGAIGVQAMGLHDDNLWEAARAALLQGPETPVVMQVVSVDPWQTRTATLGSSGRVVRINLRDLNDELPFPPGCQLDHVRSVSSVDVISLRCTLATDRLN